MNYIGSKLKLSSWIKDNICDVVGGLSDRVFCDMFAGTGIVGRTFKSDVKRVIANDMEDFAYVLNRNYIQNHKKLNEKKRWIEYLNALEPKEGFIYRHYCMGSGSKRNYFTDLNAKKIDTTRSEIEELKKSGKIDEDTYYFLLASLIESADKVANTASVYGAFLKHIKKSAQKELILKSADFLENDNTHQVFKKDANELIKEIEGDILYLDPPYNARQYGANYHLLNTIVKYDEFIPRGKTGLREYKKSDYCSKSKVKKAFYDLIKNAKFRYIFLSYNDEGLMSKDEVKDVMQQFGRYELTTKEYQRFKADKDTNRVHKKDKTYEYLHILQKV